MSKNGMVAYTRNGNWVIYNREYNETYEIGTEKELAWVKEEYKDFGYNLISHFVVDIFVNGIFGDTDKIRKAGGVKNYKEEVKKACEKCREHSLWLSDGRKIGYIKKKRLELHKDLVTKYRRNPVMLYKFNQSIEKKIFIAKQDLTDAVKSDLKNRLNLTREDFLLLLNEIIPYKSYDSLIDLYNALQNIDIFNKLNVSNNSFEPCSLFRDLKSKYREDNNIYRILLINPETEKYFRLNILDFVSLFDIDIISYVESQGIEIKELRDKRERYNNNKQRVKEELKKYDDLLEKISNKQFLKQYPSLNKYLKSYWWFVKEFVKIGKENIEKYEILPEAEDIIFYSSCRYLQSKVSQTIDISLISRVLNTLCIFGIIKKVFNPDGFSCNKYYKEYEVGYDINYFSVKNDIDWIEANKKAETLTNNKVKVSNISKKKVADIWGKFEAEKVFSNPHVI